VGGVAGLFVMMFSNIFRFIPVVGDAIAAAATMIGLFTVAMGVLGIVAGAQGLQGQSWARWTMVGLFGAGVLMGLGTVLVSIVCVGAIVCLVTQPANDWYNAHDRRTVPVR
jgi:TRAP-type uncharacterized transport system fused permease subunit